MLDTKTKHKDKVAITTEQEQELVLDFDTRITPHTNHTLWEINLVNGEIKRATFNLNTTIEGRWDWKKGDKIQGALSLVRNDNCEYVSALNKENAFKLLSKGSNGSKFDINKEYLKL